MKRTLKMFLSFASVFLLSACADSAVEDVRIENVEASEIRSDFLEEALIDIQSEGIHQVNTGKKGYIIFNGVKSEYTNVKVELEDEILQIIFDKIKSDESAKQIYEIKPYPSEKFDTIQLIENGKETHFETGYF